ncbi:MAG: cytochrome c [Alphaproteobacteria bacterium]|nr:cytochrome c [Alphaproteobacteria bacterium]MBL6938946.1 cytochrome c [Alphaproteobacteria bacterium]MBL7099538.1 cytochrome c [Alphaproteobacteria bacterium]
MLALKGDPVRGEAIYEKTCSQCHQSKSGWSYTISIYQPQGVLSTVIDGVKGSKMPSFAAYSNRDLADLYAYVATLK